MDFQQFRNEFFKLGCFSVNQVYAVHDRFNRLNLVNWTKKGLLLKLRNGYYSFPEYLKQPNYGFYVANRIYKPSYISIHSALAFYGIIPEAVVQITSVSSLKTSAFENAFGSYSYHNLLPKLFFGYESKPLTRETSILMAYPEKAILDLLYLYPAYNTAQEMEELRFDEDYLQEELKIERLKEYAERFQKKALTKRVDLFLETYGL